MNRKKTDSIILTSHEKQREYFGIYQIELTNHCNMECPYCPHHKMTREKGFMSNKTLAACINWIQGYGGRRIVIHNFGEPLLHRNIKECLVQITEAEIPVQFSTNGLLLEKYWNMLKKLQTPLSIMISGHKYLDQPTDYLKMLLYWKDRAKGTRISILKAYNFDGEKFHLHNWASGVPDSWDIHKCPFIRQNFAVILWNGDIACCCVDYQGTTVAYNIHDPMARFHITKPWDSCTSCDVGRLMIEEVW